MPSTIAVSPFGVAPHALVAPGCRPGPMPTPAGTRIALQFMHLHGPTRSIDLPGRPGDASCEKNLPMRHPTSARHLNHLKNNSLKPRFYELHIRGLDASPGVGSSKQLGRRGAANPGCSRLSGGFFASFALLQFGGSPSKLPRHGSFVASRLNSAVSEIRP